ncbi:hypothetical protein Ssi03_76640 [Sphaerisporangium siamense]|nr:hypothetical protein Ssi03_76640 [Sphaerisporangium siamense]
MLYPLLYTALWPAASPSHPMAGDPYRRATKPEERKPRGSIKLRLNDEVRSPLRPPATWVTLGCLTPHSSYPKTRIV